MASEMVLAGGYQISRNDTQYQQVHMISLLFGSSLGHFWVKKFRPSKPRGKKREPFLAKNKEKVLKTEVFRTFCGGDKRDRTADLLNAIEPMPRLVEDYCAAERKSVEIQGFFGSFNVGLLE